MMADPVLADLARRYPSWTFTTLRVTAPSGFETRLRARRGTRTLTARDVLSLTAKLDAAQQADAARA
jgi:hypothetical protein